MISSFASLAIISIALIQINSAASEDLTSSEFNEQQRRIVKRFNDGIYGGNKNPFVDDDDEPHEPHLKKMVHGNHDDKNKNKKRATNDLFGMLGKIGESAKKAKETVENITNKIKAVLQFVPKK